MKKNLGKVLFLFVLVISVTGCSRRLTCTKSDKTDYLTTQETFMAAYQDDTLKVLQIELRVTLKKKYEDYGEKVLQNLEEQFKNYQDKKGVTLQTGNHDNIVRIHLLLDVDKMKKKDLEEFNIVNLKEDIHDLEKNLEKKDYVCS